MIVVTKNRPIHQIFQNIQNEETKEDKVKVLKRYDNKAIRWYVDNLYNRDWSVVEIPKFSYCHRPYGNCNINLSKAISRLEQSFYYHDKKPEVTERMLLLVLSEVSREEAELLLDLFAGRKIKGIHKSVFKEVYPEFFRSAATSKTSGDTDQEAV